MSQHTVSNQSPARRAKPSPHSTGDRTPRARLSILVLSGALAAISFLSLSLGATGFTPGDVFSALLGLTDTNIPAGTWSPDLIILEIRAPRTALGILVGAVLALAGTMMQGLFRNPLADPGLIGISAGASLGAVIIIVLGAPLLALSAFATTFALPLAAFFGALVTTFILYKVGTRVGRTSVATMLLAGIALTAFAMAFTGILVFISDDQQLRDFTFWNLGSLAGATWAKILPSLPFMLSILIAIPFLARGLNALVLGESEAYHLGIPVQKFKRIIIVVVACSVGGAVANAGGIGFIGIVVPHMLRLSIGPDHRYLLPASALLGASILLLADIVCRVIVAPAELPIGIITALFGAPFFLWLLLRKRGIIDM